MGCTPSTAAAPVDRSVKEEEEEEMEPETTAHAEYNFREKIGKGSFASVHIALRRHTKAEVAVKICVLHPERVTKPDLEDRELKATIREVSVWKTVGAHRNCVQLLDSFFDGHLAYMVMERCDCTLFKYLQGFANVYETCLGRAFKHILTGLSHMHSVSVVHRDLKPANFLVRGDTVKICDFGLSAMLPESGCISGQVGTAPYMPPEMLATNMYDAKADVWSFGCVAYLFLCGEFPYQTSDGSVKMMKRSILNGFAPDCERAWLSIKAISFLRQMLRRKPSQRPTAELALKSPFISNPDTKHLPCIRNVLYKGKRTGAYDASDVASATQTDWTLSKLKKGELPNAFIKSFPSVNVNEVGTKAQKQKLSSKVCESLHDDPSGRSESTAYGTSESPRFTSESSSSEAFSDII